MRLDDTRRADLVTALGAVRARIADACTAAGRDAGSVTLVAVTKTYPASDVLILTELGLLDIGESRDQEAAAKVGAVETALRELPDADRPRPNWHFVGRLQSRKCRSVAAYAAAVHSVDRPQLVRRLADAVDLDVRRRLDVFVQVSLDGDPDRGGVLPEGVAALAEAVGAREELRLCGVMAVAPLGADPDPAFAELAAVSQQLQSDHPHADAISAGMSDDLEAALRHGSTHVRVGTALLGRRPPVFG
jgi:pyridoxal phosphate enzyme (YggS family)